MLKIVSKVPGPTSIMDRPVIKTKNVVIARMRAAREFKYDDDRLNNLKGVTGQTGKK